MSDVPSPSHSSPGMGELAERYARMADEELLLLARDKGTLLESARLALDAEMEKRGVRPAEPPKPVPELPPSPAAGGPTGRWKGWKTAFVTAETAPRAGILIRTGKLHEFYLDTFRLYRDHSRIFAKIVVPVGLLNYGLWVARVMASAALVRVFFKGRLGWGGFPPGFWPAMTAVNAPIYVLTWILSCAAFAGVVIAVHQLVEGREAGVRKCWQELRRRMGPFLRAALLLGVLVGAGIGVATWVAVTFFAVAQELWLVVGRQFSPCTS